MKKPPIKHLNFLESERLILRPLVVADTKGDYAKWLNDPEVCAENSHAVFPATLPALRDYVAKISVSRSDVVLAMELKKGRKHIGNISLQNINWVNRGAELAILIGAKSCWGKGYGLEAVTLMVDYGFQKLGLHRIYCGTFAGNKGMSCVAKKLGFVEEGRRRDSVFKEGKYQDVIEYGLLAGERTGRKK
ncbi:MAG: GNAT family protein [Chthoniobacterales bacterium]